MWICGCWSADGLRRRYAAQHRQLGRQRGPDQVALMLDIAEPVKFCQHMLLTEAGAILADMTPDIPAPPRRHRGAIGRGAAARGGRPRL